MSVPGELHDLVERFDRDRDAYRSGTYNEAQARVDFINPLLGLLGWDVENREGRPEAYRDVVYEDRVKVGGGTKAPDYGFYAGGRRRFFLEAKKPSIDIAGDVAPAVQLRRYAWSARMPLSVLTDFEEFAVYDCRSEPEKDDAATTARLELFTYDRYPEDEVWHSISSVFSREAVLDGSLERYAEENRKRRGKETVDAAFLREIEGWRSDLARDIAARNDLNTRSLNFAVQMTIDRIIFLRMAEDRGIEDYGRLMALLNGSDTYRRLCEIFRDADDRYNSGLFHFRGERRRDEEPDRLTPALEIDDTVLKGIIRGLYYPESPYEFSVLPVDVLGHVYEQFLGRVIRLEDNHTATVEEKPEVRKAGGVYYTPTYIVDYIVERTVGKLLEGKRPGPRGGVSRLKIVDPACGSGSFLIGAYTYLLDWHRDRYVEDGPEKWSKVLYRGPGDQWHLTIDEKKRILLNNIYGVDIDPQAVEVTKLSLLLKVLEGESEASLATQLRMFQERALPDLDQNIKCGNSLIGPNFYDNEQMMLLDEEEHYRINVFDWNEAFPQVFGGDNPGFDAVIGNPPYLRIQGLQEHYSNQLEYFTKHYVSAVRRFDLYLLFTERGLRLLSTNGRLGFIIPHKFLHSAFGSGLRQVLVDGLALETFLSFGSNLIFDQASTYTGIITLNRNGDPYFTYYEFPSTGHQELGKSLTYSNELDCVTYDLRSLNAQPWTFGSTETQSLIKKLNQQKASVGDAFESVFQGIVTGADSIYFLIPVTDNGTIIEVLSQRNGKRFMIEKAAVKPLLKGEDVSRYAAPIFEHYCIYPYKLVGNKTVILEEDEFFKEFPLAFGYLDQFRDELRDLRIKYKTNPGYWYSCHRGRSRTAFESKRIITSEISFACNMTLDTEGLYHNTTVYSLLPSKSFEETKPYWLGILNSAVMWWFLKNTGNVLRGGYFRFKTNYLKPFPLRTIDFSDPADVAQHDHMVELVKRMLSLHERLAGARIERERTVIGHQISATDRQIDRLVYELYDLTDEEIRIVEEARVR